MIRRLLASLMLGSVIVACGDSGGPGTLLFLAEVAGDSQTIATSATSGPMVVQVVDTLGQPVPGIEVKFSLTQGSGTVIARDTSGEDGTAQTVFTADATPGTRKIKASGVVTDVLFTLFVVSPATSPDPR